MCGKENKGYSLFFLCSAVSADKFGAGGGVRQSRPAPQPHYHPVSGWCSVLTFHYCPPPPPEDSSNHLPDPPTTEGPLFGPSNMPQVPGVLRLRPPNALCQSNRGAVFPSFAVCLRMFPQMSVDLCM